MPRPLTRRPVADQIAQSGTSCSLSVLSMPSLEDKAKTKYKQKGKKEKAEQAAIRFDEDLCLNPCLAAEITRSEA